MNPRALLAEFVGTFTLVFAGVGSIAANQMSGGAVGLTGIALAHGLAIGIMVSATMAVSGGHLNPAVTFGALLGGKITMQNAIAYVVSQCLGAIVAAWFITLAIPGPVVEAVKLGTPALGNGVSAGEGVVVEAVLTFFLVFVVYGTAMDARAPKVGGLFIGLAVAMGVLAGGPLTGAALNPARHIGPALVGGGLGDTWLYWVGPLLGGGAAGLVYHFGIEQANV